MEGRHQIVTDLRQFLADKEREYNELQRRKDAAALAIRGSQNSYVELLYLKRCIKKLRQSTDPIERAEAERLAATWPTCVRLHRQIIQEARRILDEAESVPAEEQALLAEIEQAKESFQERVRQLG